MQIHESIRRGNRFRLPKRQRKNCDKKNQKRSQILRLFQLPSLYLRSLEVGRHKIYPRVILNLFQNFNFDFLVGFCFLACARISMEQALAILIRKQDFSSMTVFLPGWLQNKNSSKSLPSNLS